jgi:hypothetical protein
MKNQFNIGDTVYFIDKRFPEKINCLEIFSIQLKDDEIHFNKDSSYNSFLIKYDESEIKKECYTYKECFYSKNQEILKEFFYKAQIEDYRKYIEDRKKDTLKFEATIREYYQKLMTINN